jgi:hypothetical protein
MQGSASSVLSPQSAVLAPQSSVLREMLRNSLERRVLGLLSLLLLSLWALACITDYNHPPGVRYVRVLAILLVTLVGMLEFRRPWWGFYVLLLFWPQSLAIREFCVQFISPLFDGLPDFWGGPLACALTLGVLARESAERPLLPPLEKTPPPLRLFRGALWFFAGAYTLTAIIGYFRLNAPPPDWPIPHASWRVFLNPGVSQLTPLTSLLSLLPPLLLGLALLNLLADKPGVLQPPVQKLIALSCASGLLAALQLFIQIKMGSFGYRFTGGWIPAGPFEHRNTAGPVFALFFALACIAADRARRCGKVNNAALFLGSGMVLLLAAYMSTSRNALFILLAIPWLALLARPTVLRAAAAVLIPAAGLALVFWMPLPHSDPNPRNAVDRILLTIENARAGEVNGLSGGRTPLFQTALNIGRDFPLAGSGVGSFPILARPDSPYRAPGLVDAYGAAHSMPLNLFAESGIIVALGWLLLWILLPLAALLRAPRAGGVCVVLLAFGLGNLVDTMWLVPGITTFSILLIYLACCELS